jgi:hypothetical protein
MYICNSKFIYIYIYIYTYIYILESRHGLQIYPVNEEDESVDQNDSDYNTFNGISGHLVLTVTDTGVGMNAKVWILIPFYH